MDPEPADCGCSCVLRTSFTGGTATGWRWHWTSPLCRTLLRTRSLPSGRRWLLNWTAFKHSRCTGTNGRGAGLRTAHSASFSRNNCSRDTTATSSPARVLLGPHRLARPLGLTNTFTGCRTCRKYSLKAAVLGGITRSYGDRTTTGLGRLETLVTLESALDVDGHYFTFTTTL